MRRVKSSGLSSIEDALLQALTISPSAVDSRREKRTGADLIAALQASPHRELDIEPPKVLLTTVRDVVL
jgi:hypothetical protein